MVRVEAEGGGERSDVADERDVLERWRRGRQEGELTHFAVGRGGRLVGAVRAAGGALLRRVVLLHPETDHLTRKTKQVKIHLNIYRCPAVDGDGTDFRRENFNISNIMIYSLLYLDDKQTEAVHYLRLQKNLTSEHQLLVESQPRSAATNVGSNRRVKH